MVRKGMGKGTGKGYKNIIGVDKKIHSMSAKGIKQPQRINPITLSNIYQKKEQKLINILNSTIIDNIVDFEAYLNNNNKKYLIWEISSFDYVGNRNSRENVSGWKKIDKKNKNKIINEEKKLLESIAKKSGYNTKIVKDDLGYSLVFIRNDIFKDKEAVDFIIRKVKGDISFKELFKNPL